MKIAILGPVHALALKPYIQNLYNDDNSIPPGMGGYVLANLIIERLNRELETEVITLDPLATKPIQKWEGKFFRLWIVQRRKNKLLRDCYKREIKLIHRVLKEIKPDVCHANWTYEYGLAAVTQRNIPVVLTVHDHTFNILKKSGPIYLPQFLITNYVLLKSNYITAVSPYVAKLLKRLYNKSVYITPNVLPEFIWKIKRNISYNNTITIFSSLIISSFKNSYRALKSFKIAKKYFDKKGIRVVYKISGIREDDIPKPWLKIPDLFKNVYLLGRLSYYENIVEMSKSDVLFHPSLEESMGMPIAEGMALNKPIIAASEAGGARWLLDNGKYGILTQGKSVKKMSVDLIGLIERFLNGEYNTINACKRIKNICNSDDIIFKYENLYKYAIKKWSY